MAPGMDVWHRRARLFYLRLVGAGMITVCSVFARHVASCTAGAAIITRAGTGTRWAFFFGPALTGGNFEPVNIKKDS